MGARGALGGRKQNVLFPFRRGQYASHKKAIEKHLEDMFDGPGPPGAAKRPQRPPRNQICTALLYGRAGRLTALLGRCPARADMLADESHDSSQERLRRRCASGNNIVRSLPQRGGGERGGGGTSKE
jgi:hypothetical protein